MSENKKIVQKDEIDLFQLATVVWASRIRIIKIAGVFGLICAVISLTLSPEYEAKCVLMPESSQSTKSNLGGLSGLAGLAGINLNVGESSGTISPLLYPKIVESTPFQLELLKHPIRYKEQDTTISSYYYFTELKGNSFFGVIYEYTIKLPGKIKSLFREDESVMKHSSDQNFIQMSKDDWNLLEAFRERFIVAIDAETGLITIVGEMPDPYAAAEIVNLLVKNLTGDVTDYKLEKARDNLDFIEGEYAEAKEEYESIQRKLAQFMDRNKNITSSYAQLEYQKLNNELDLAFGTFKSLGSQLEQARITLKEETPVFTIIEPIKVPINKSKPQRTLIVFLGIIFGGIIGAAYVLVKSELKLVDD